MSRPKVYVSGPITRGDRSHNVFQFMRAHQILLEKGFAPFNPGLSALLPWAWELPHNVWIESDLPWVECSDWLIRLPGESVGADMEVEHARKHNIPVMFIDDVKQLERVEHVQSDRNGEDTCRSGSNKHPAIDRLEYATY